jgi:hypothetical protein
MDISSPKYFELREGILDAEVMILAKLAFNVHVEHPHGFLLNYLSSMELVKHDGFAQQALNFLNDRYILLTEFVHFCLLSIPTKHNCLRYCISYRSCLVHSTTETTRLVHSL